MAKAIMIQGTMSNAGKSLTAAALCRIFAQDGYRVAPFKSQNMALNSFITADGLEMGRAQVVQAEAAYKEPDVRMNPILLKPTNDTGSQVIVGGRVVGDMSAREYYKHKLDFVPAIMEAYNSLSAENDIIVIEGAGSPAEINLKQNDIVNMGMARLAQSPVLLVGDIDRGGVFAQLYGTVALLEEEEKSLIKGLIINKFRGDKEILRPGLDMLERRVNKRFLGVIPYINCDIDDEDSLTERFNTRQNTGLVDIAVIKLPRISNFTDFNALARVNGVSLRYVSTAEEFGSPDAVILAGTKSTVSDLLWLRANGIEAKIKQHAARGKLVFGICGGYQMLGKRITDEVGAEKKGVYSGIGLLDCETVFTSTKKRTQTSGSFNNIGGVLSALSGTAFKGYEIHMGETRLLDSKPLTTLKNGTLDGCCEGNVYGTYIHGIFDGEEVVKRLVSALMSQKGISSEAVEAFDAETYKRRQYDMLADAVRQSLDMKQVYDILDRGVDNG